MSHPVERRWYPISFAVAALVLLPLSILLFSWGSIDGEIWAHLWDTQMPRLLGNTLTLVLGVGIGVVVLGVSLAWLTALCEFPGRRWLDWALMLPFAIPAYVLAFVFIGLLDFSGPVQSLATRLAGNALAIGASAVGILFRMLAIGLFTFYLVADGPKVRRTICSFLPPDRQRHVLEKWDIAIDKTGGSLYSRLLLALISALFPWGFFELIGVPYAAAKAAIVGLTKRLAKEVGPDRVRVNAIAPGLVLTERLQHMFDAMDPAEQREVVEAIPLRRMPQLAEIVEPILFLAGDAAGYITGVVLDVNGGRFMPL